MNEKQCFKCNAVKPISEFHKHRQMADGHLNKCKVCTRADVRASRAANYEYYQQYNKERYAADPEKKKRYAKQYRENNPEKCRERARAWCKANPEKRKEILRRYTEKHPGLSTQYEKRRKAVDPAFAMAKRLRVRLRNAVRAANGKKAGNTLDLIGCSPRQLVEHLEAQFLPGMSWDNRNQWHIDHIKPCSSFDLTNPFQQRQCFHYSNLQPLWATDNLRKSDRKFDLDLGEQHYK